MRKARDPQDDSRATIGWIDTPSAEGVVGPAVCVHGWALARAGIRGVDVLLDEHRFAAQYGLPRADVAAMHPGYPDGAHGGFAFDADLSAWPAPPNVDRRALRIVAVDRAGHETLLGTRALVEPRAHARWRFVERGHAKPFHLLPALSGITSGGAFGLESHYAAYASDTTRIGMRVPILYLRTTHGARGDYAFDASFDTQRMNGARAVAEDALAPVLAHAAAHRLPILVTLNGGIWSDASGTCPEWDLTDLLEEDVVNCQWNERNEVMPDHHLAHLPGSQASPELARALTLNVFASRVRALKRRNLQQAARHVEQFMRETPDLFVGVTLDPDVYVNPFFTGTQWYDYNPGTLRQFRHWLAGSGPYAGACEAGVPDLSAYRRAHPLSLDDASALARRRFARWEDVDPPRAFPHDTAHPHWKDPWVAQWEVFRRHLVKLHYDELAQWVADAGIPSNRIWSSQGLDAPADVYAPPEGFMPVALSEWSPPRNFDSGGVSIEGSKPRDGHLGAIVYGAAATNTMPMENGERLYATLARIDPDFGIVEFNTADLRHAERHPTYADAYRALRDLWNAGTRFVSPMAWNGSNGAHAHAPGYVAFTAWRNTPLEEAARDFLLARSGVPRGSKLWTFGSPTHADDDGWSAAAGTLHARPGALELTADASGSVVLVSPPDIGCARVARVVLALDESIDGTVDIAVAASVDAAWTSIGRAALASLARTPAGLVVDGEAASAYRLRVALSIPPRARVMLARIAILRH
jgi:hypothetical protein